MFEPKAEENQLNKWSNQIFLDFALLTNLASYWPTYIYMKEIQSEPANLADNVRYLVYNFLYVNSKVRKIQKDDVREFCTLPVFLLKLK
jgi:hypothetical protein